MQTVPVPPAAQAAATGETAVAGDAVAPEPQAMDLQRQLTTDLAPELHNGVSLHTPDREHPPRKLTLGILPLHIAKI